jgi:hypothetical protein
MTNGKPGVDSHLEEDDVDMLVRQVIAENPAAEVGLREEWDHKTGWHRKEDIHSSSDIVAKQSNKYIRQRKNNRLEQAVQSIAQEKEPTLNVDRNRSNALGTTYFSRPTVFAIGLFLSFLSVTALVRIYGLFRGRKLRSS